MVRWAPFGGHGRVRLAPFGGHMNKRVGSASSGGLMIVYHRRHGRLTYIEVTNEHTSIDIAHNE